MNRLINYVKPIEDTFIETAMFLLPVLVLRLTAIRHPHDLDMPSWVPDWSQNLPLSFNFFNWNPGQPELKPFNPHHHGIRSSPSGENASRLELIATGCQYARIVYRTQEFLITDLEDAEVQMKILYYNFASLRELIDWEDMQYCDSNIPSQLGKEIVDGTYVDSIFVAKYD